MSSQKTTTHKIKEDFGTASSLGAKTRLDEAVRYAIKEGIKGSFYGLAGSVILTGLLNRYSSIYRSITLAGKMILVSVGTIGVGMIKSERAIYDFSRSHLKDQIQAREEEYRVSHDWVETLFNHRYEIVASALFGSLILSYIMVDRRHPHLPTMQKVMNARLWAQSVGICGTVGAMAVGKYLHNRQ